jgi:DNA-binding transcriptional MerR regulator
MDGNRRTYRVHEFAALTGVSVRARHHYDRLDLLRPRRAASRYRIYGADDEAILEQIVALKFIGIPLGDIKRLLRTEPGESRKVVAAQRALPAAMSPEPRSMEPCSRDHLIAVTPSRACNSWRASATTSSSML